MNEKKILVSDRVLELAREHIIPDVTAEELADFLDAYEKTKPIVTTSGTVNTPEPLAQGRADGGQPC